MATIFSKIIAGEIPAFKLFENEHVFAFLDIRPINPGHSLVVPKAEFDHILDVPEPYYSAVGQAAKHLGKAIQIATKCERIGLAVMGFEVPHYHLHVVPLWQESDLDFRRAKPAAQADLEQIQTAVLASLPASGVI